jgi:DNA-binding CsgD family transcriptional regulator
MNASSAATVLTALRMADEHGGALAALQANGAELPQSVQLGLADRLDALVGRADGDEAVGEALALGFLAGQLTVRPRSGTVADPTAFLMDRELRVRGAEGESILRLPWFDDELFVGRQLPDISEMPQTVRGLCVTNYRAALAGTQGRFSFCSYGHAYEVDAVPVHGPDGRIERVLAIATPAPAHAASAVACEQIAARFDAFAEAAEQRAALHARAGRHVEQRAEQEAAARARDAATRAAGHARVLRRRTPACASAAPRLTPRELEVLQLASHGLTAAEIAEQLVVSAGTVKTHLHNIYPKLRVTDKAAAVAAALRHGLID